MSFLNITSKFEKVMGKEAELLEAARTGNLATVEKLLTNKARKSNIGGGASIGQKLTSFLKSVNVNYTDKNGYTALHHAAVNGHRDIVEVLLRSDAQPGIVDTQGCTPVHLAAWNGDAEVVMQLLTAGHDSETVDPVSINQQNGTGDTALHCAAQYGHVAVVDVLLNKSAAPTVRNLDEASPLDLAAQYGRLEVVQRLLISHPELAHHPSSTQSPLHLASRNGHRDIVAVLLDNHFDIQLVTDDGSALHEAALHGKLDVVKLLLERGIDVNHRDQKQQTVIQLLSAHQSQQKSFTLIMQAIQNHIGEMEQDSGLYDSLSNCRSVANDKPTAAVKPLPPETSNQSEKPSPPDKPRPPVDIQVVSDQSPSHLSPDKPTPHPRKSLSASPEEEKPVIPLYSKPNKESFKNADRVASTTSSIHDDAPPPLPPRTSIFAVPDEKQSVSTQQTQQTEAVTTNVEDKSPKSTMSIPKKPPRQKKSPLSVRKTQVTDIPSTDITPPPPPEIETFQNIPYHNMDIPSTQCDNLKIEPTQNAKQSVDQSHSSLAASDQSDTSKTHSPTSGPPTHSTTSVSLTDSKTSEPPTHSTTSGPPTHSPTPGPPVPNKPKLSPKPALPRRPTIPKPKEDNSVDPMTGRQVKQPFYMEMTGRQSTGQPTSKPVSSKPVSEVKPHVKITVNEDRPSDIDLTPTRSSNTNLTTTQPKEDNYGMLFQNFKKDPKKNLQKPELRRINTAPEETEYVKPYPVSPTDKFKDKQKQGLQRANTAPEETYVAMNNPNKTNDQREDGADQKCVEPKENEYSEIPEKDGPPSSPNENVYATILETKDEKGGEANEYTKMSDITVPPVSPPQDKGNKAPEPKVSPKPNYLEFMKNKPNTPLTPTGYPQPPTPDFPPPSPATAMMGIELKIQQIDTKRKSRDITTLTDDTTLESIQEHKSEVKVTAQSEVKVTAQTVEVKDVDKSSKSPETVSDNIDNKVDVKTVSVSANSGAEEKPETKEEESVYGVLSECRSVIKDSTKDIPESSIPTKPVIESVTVETAQSVNTEPVVDTMDKVKVMEGATSETGNRDDNEGSPVVMRKKSSSGNPDMDVFKGLLRGSTIDGPPKVRSQFYNDVIRQSRIRNPDTKPIIPLKPTMDKDEDIDVDQVMKSIDVEVAKRASTSDAGNFDDTEEWAKIQDIMESFGGGIARESVFVRDFQPAFTKLLAGSGQMISVGEWLESVCLPQYENAFVANGYDNIDFLDHKILEEGDLEQIGVLSHDHRQKLLQATRSLPQLQPIDPGNPPPSVEEWLLQLQLLDYLETFRSHGYDTMEKVQSILWELQLRTVLDISMLGHRKRILTSLGERKPQGSQKKRSISSLSPEETRSPFNNIDLFKDYTHVKPVSSSEEDIKETSQMVVDSSEDEDVFKKQGGQSIRNSNIHLRPPHLAQTSSPARQWRHKPEMLIKGCCNYTAQYLGSTVVPELTGGTESTRAGITKLKKSADIIAKIPIIMLSISYKGVKFIDAKSKKVICDHEIGNIFCACQDTDNLNFFAYITRDIQTGQHYCHVFSVKSSSLAHDIILTLGESFEVAYQMALKEKSAEEAMELDRKMSQSDPEDAYSTKSSLSTNTV